uniref:Uncharacterized protein n=1 Tax=Aegilops tauschii subsp. strangulata TaxID=200361 RepID=A0A453ND60_AEGTS
MQPRRFVEQLLGKDQLSSPTPHRCRPFQRARVTAIKQLTELIKRMATRQSLVTTRPNVPGRLRPRPEHGQLTPSRC